MRRQVFWQVDQQLSRARTCIRSGKTQAALEAMLMACWLMGVESS
jgi:hypothetical protein